MDRNFADSQCVDILQNPVQNFQNFSKTNENQ